MYSSAAHKIYAHNEMGITSSEKLIEMLYEGVLRFNAQAKKAIQNEKIEMKVYWINRSIAVITELISVLEFKESRVAQYLDGLYRYEIQLLLLANSRNEVKNIDEVTNVFRGLLEAWREITHVAK